jgi:hypothetical protein
MGIVSQWLLLLRCHGTAVHPPQMGRMGKTKTEMSGDQMVKEGEAWKKIMTM